MSNAESTGSAHDAMIKVENNTGPAEDTLSTGPDDQHWHSVQDAIDADMPDYGPDDVGAQ